MMSRIAPRVHRTSLVSAEGGLRYDDPRLGLTWPLPIGEMSTKDAEWTLLDEVEAELVERMGA